MLDLNNLSELCFKISEKRQKNGDFGKRLNTTENILKHCATEVVEAMAESESEIEFKKELADIIICVLVIAGMEKIDIEDAILDCIDKNLKRSEKNV